MGQYIGPDGTIYEDAPGGGYRVVGQHSTAGPVTIGTPDPNVALSRMKTQAELARMASEAAKGSATQPYDIRKAAAEATSAEANATIARQKADQAKAESALATMGPNSSVTGEEYLRRFVPPEMWNTVRAYARGDLGSRAGGMSTSMLPIIQHAMNYDPTISGTNFPARVKMQSDLAGSQPNTLGGALRATERMLLHGREVLRGGASLDNYGPGLLGTIGNAVRTGYEQATNDPGVSHYEELVRNYGPEAQKAIAQTSGGQTERQDRSASFGASLPQATRAGALQADARQAFDAMAAANAQYRRLMGRDITDALSPDARAAYDEIMAGGYGAGGKPLHPAAGWSPRQAPAGGGGGGGADGGAPPGGDGGPDVGGIATGATRTIPDPDASRKIDQLIRSGVSATDAARIVPINVSQYVAAQAYLRAHPTYKGSFGAATKEVPTTAHERISGSPLGVGILAGADAAIGGLTDEVGGGINALAKGTSWSDETAKLDAAKQLAFAQNPGASTAGQLIGGVGAAYGLGGAVKGLSIASKLANPALASDIAFGALSGAGQDNDNRLFGAATGGLGGLAGNLAGSAVSVPAGALARTKAGLALVNKARQAAGAVPGITPRTPIIGANAPTAAERAVTSALEKTGVPDVTSNLADAQAQNVPFTLADASPSLGELAAAAARRSPAARDLAENVLLPRNRGQIDRFGQAVERNLGLTANIPQLSADLTQQARTAAAPLYDAAYAAPGASSVDLSDLADRPLSMRPGLARARAIAQEEGRDPTALGFDLNDQGEPVLTRVPSFQTLDYVKRGLDDMLEPHRDPITGRLALNESTRAINGTKNELLGRIDAVNPAYAQARAAYAGPVQARDALALGQDAINLQPDELGMQVAGQSPEHLAQMQLGYRGALMDRANGVRYSNNPFEATLGTPASEQRLATLYPDNPGVAAMLRQRDLERTMAQTATRVVGGSPTAGRLIADQAFQADPMVESALHAGAAVATHGASLPGTAARLAGAGLRDRMSMGLGKQAVSKADDVAGMLLNPDPAANNVIVQRMLDQQALWQAFVAATRPKDAFSRVGAVAGANAGASGAR